MKTHRYTTKMAWTGNKGQGTKNYALYSRNHTYNTEGKPEIQGSSDANFRGDPLRYNPEELLVCSLSSCHMLWYLHFCSVNGIVVETYEDQPEGILEEMPDGNGKFTEVILRPQVKISSGDMAKARSLHEDAHKFCFIANSVNFEVKCEAETMKQ